MNWKKSYKYWQEKSPRKIQLKIEKFSDEEKELYFGKEIEFGTAGLRGKIGYFSSGINEFVIAKYSLAFAKHLLAKHGTQAKKEGIVIAHDNRRNNILYSETAAKVFSAMGIPVFFFKKNELQPSPLLSYVIMKGEYVGGINITASHNPPEYNGFKVYGHSGAQLLPVETESILSFANEDINIFKIKMDKVLINELSNSIINTYINEVVTMIPFHNEDRKNIKVIYTSQHGTATKIATTILEKMKVEFEMVKEQSYPDPEFKNTISPNPQNPDAFILARKYGNEMKADVLFSTDPDADRFGIEVMHNGEWLGIDGNHLPLVQVHYKLNRLNELGYITKGDFIVRSVVTSNAADKVAEKFGVKVYKNLTGFKWLMLEVQKHEKMGNECLFAWEESYGSTVRTITRDKDSFQALVQVIEIVKYYKDKGMTIIDALNEIQDEIGYFCSPQTSIRIEGTDAKEKLEKFTKKFKNIRVGDQLNGFEVTKIIDFSTGYKHYSKQDLLILRFDNKHAINIRPSGTEPILKIYYNAVESTRNSSLETIEKLKAVVKEITD